MFAFFPAGSLRPASKNLPDDLKPLINGRSRLAPVLRNFICCASALFLLSLFLASTSPDAASGQTQGTNTCEQESNFYNYQCSENGCTEPWKVSGVELRTCGDAAKTCCYTRKTGENTCKYEDPDLNYQCFENGCAESWRASGHRSCGDDAKTCCYTPKTEKNTCQQEDKRYNYQCFENGCAEPWEKSTLRSCGDAAKTCCYTPKTQEEKEKEGGSGSPDGQFESTWDTTKTSFQSSDENQITLPLDDGGDYDFTVDWGDGSTSRITSWNSPDKTHTYQNPGTYTLKITGQIEGFGFSYLGDKAKIIRITKWGPLKLGNQGGYFHGASNLVDITDKPDLTGTTNLANMFDGASKFNGNINSWDVSAATNMNSMFKDAASFNRAPEQLGRFQQQQTCEACSRAPPASTSLWKAGTCQQQHTWAQCSIPADSTSP